MKRIEVVCLLPSIFSTASNTFCATLCADGRLGARSINPRGKLDVPFAYSLSKNQRECVVVVVLLLLFLLLLKKTFPYRILIYNGANSPK